MSRSAARWGFVVVVVLATVVVPFFVWGDALATWIDAFVRGEHPRWEVAAVLAGLLAADVVLPIPSSVTMVAAGIALGAAAGTATSWVGMTVGCLVGYELGLRLGRPGVRRLVEPEQLDRVQRFVERYGDAMLIGLRPLPVMAEASTLFAGISRLPRGRFLALCAGGNLVIAAVYGSIGDLAAASGRYELGLVGALGIPAVAMLAARAIRERRR